MALSPCAPECPCAPVPLSAFLVARRRLLQLPLNNVVGVEGAEGLAAPAGYQEALLREGACRTLVLLLEESGLEGDMALLPVNLLSRLVLSSTSFAQQFITAGGLAPGLMQRLLRDTNPTPLLIDVLLVRTQRTYLF